MCTVLLAWKVAPDASIVVGANRDEFRERSAEAPKLLVKEPAVYGGRDALAGGTWLAVAPGVGKVAAVTNRITGASRGIRDDRKRSRGELPVLALQQDDATVRTWMEQLTPEDYNPVNLLYISLEKALWLSLDPDAGARIMDIVPGVHVITIGDMDGVELPKDVRLQQKLSHEGSAPMHSSDIITKFHDILCDHDPEHAVCIHGGMYGTVSSSTVVVRGAGEVDYAHAQGFPCEVGWSPIMHSGWRKDP